MDTRKRRPAVCAGLVLAALAAARPAGAAFPSRPGGESADLVRLVSPRADAPLTAGSSVLVAWEAGNDLAAFARAEEWELFLSVDGGRTYVSRLTPHLDLSLRRVRVRVPNLPSEDARLLVRVGDEADEREQVLPGRFRIVAAPLAPPAWRQREPDRGESPRAGAPGVLLWAEGNRDGTGWVEREAEPPPTLGPVRVAAGFHRHQGVGPRPPAGAKLLRAAQAALDPAAVDGTPAPAPAEAPPNPRRLSQLCRWNE
jgi:hypothetical protein